MDRLRDIFKKIGRLEKDLNSEIDDAEAFSVDCRRVAKENLQKEYDNCPWYCGRYEAGMALGVSEDELDEKIVDWIVNLEKEFNAVKTKHIEGHHHILGNYKRNMKKILRGIKGQKAGLCGIGRQLI